MTNQRSWVLLVLRLGISILPQIAARSSTDDVADRFPDIIDQVSETNVENCIDQFEEMMKIAMRNWQSKNPIEASEFMGKITEDFLSCILPSELDPGAVEQIYDSDEHQEFRELKNRNDQFNLRYVPTALAAQIFQQMQDFHLRPDYKRVTDQLQNNLHKKIRDFVESDLYKKDHQTNYGILVKQMLYETCETMLRRNLMSKVEIMIDRRLNPYINNKIYVRQRFNGEFFRSAIMNLMNGLAALTENSEPYDPPNCVFEKLENTIECVFSYVAALVMLESILDKNHSALNYWAPLGVKLFDNLELLLIKIVAMHEEDIPFRFGVPTKKDYVNDIFKARASIISCIDLMREKHDKISKGDTNRTPSEDRAIDKCVKSAMEQAADLVYYIMLHASVDDVDMAMVVTLQRQTIKKIMREQMNYYSKLKHIIWFVRELIDNGILASTEDPEKSWAWKTVENWNQSPVQDPMDRLSMLFGDGAIANVTCPVTAPKQISAYETARDVCWRPVLEDLLIIESAVRKDGVSLEIVFYGHPILMNYIHVVDQGLSGTKPRRM